jgi:hypothetical protein
MKLKNLCVIFSFSLIASCGGGGATNNQNAPTNNNIAGRVADGYINGAIVFWDCNDNFRIDLGEISTTTGVNGVYSISPSPATNCKLRAEVPSTAIDEDSPGQAIGASMTLAAIDGIPNFISPLTTIPALGVMSQSELQTTLAGSTTSITDDHILAGNSGIQNHNAAKYVAEILKSVGGQIKIDNPSARIDIVNAAFKKIPSSAFTTTTPVNSVTIGNFIGSLPDFSISNPFTAFMGSATYVINENALSGINDPRRATVQAALDAINSYPEISDGANINWNMLPSSVKATFAKISDKSIFPETAEETQLKQSILQLNNATVGAIDKAHDQASREQNLAMTRVVLDASSTTIQSALILVPVPSYVTSLAKLKNLNLTKIAALSKKITTRVEILQTVTECTTGLKSALTYFSNVNTDGLLLSEASAAAQKLVACGLALSNSSDYKVAIDAIALGNTLSTDSSDLVKINGDIADIVSSALDVAQLSIPKAIWDETMLLTVKRKIYELEIQEAGDKSFNKMQAAMDVAYSKFKATLNNLGEELTHARLKPYIRMVAQGCSSDTILQNGYCVSPVSTTFQINPIIFKNINNGTTTYNSGLVLYMPTSTAYDNATVAGIGTENLTGGVAVLKTVSGQSYLQVVQSDGFASGDVLQIQAPMPLGYIPKGTVYTVKLYKGTTLVATQSVTLAAGLVTPQEGANYAFPSVTLTTYADLCPNGVATTAPWYSIPSSRIPSNPQFNLTCGSSGASANVESGDTYGRRFNTTLTVTKPIANNVPLSGTFVVQADSENGTQFIPPSSASTCNFLATEGAWNNLGGAPNSGPNGYGGYHSLAKLPGASLASLIAKINSSYIFIGDTTKTLSVSTSSTYYFLQNDVAGSYGDNSGHMTITYGCQ